MGSRFQGTLNSAPSNTELPGNLIQRKATGAKAGNLERIDFHARPAQLLALLPSPADTHVHALFDQVSFEFSHGTEHRENHPSNRR